MRPAIVSRASAGFVACASAIAVASPTLADPSDQIPGNGVFQVGPDIAPGTYQTQGAVESPYPRLRSGFPAFNVLMEDAQYPWGGW